MSALERMAAAMHFGAAVDVEAASDRQAFERITGACELVLMAQAGAPLFAIDRTWLASMGVRMKRGAVLDWGLLLNQAFVDRYGAAAAEDAAAYRARVGEA